MPKRGEIDWSKEAKFKCVRIDLGLRFFNEMKKKVREISRALQTRVEYDFYSPTGENWGSVKIQFFWRSGLNPTVANQVLNSFPSDSIEIMNYGHDSQLKNYVDSREWKRTKFLKFLSRIKKSFQNSLEQT